MKAKFQPTPSSVSAIQKCATVMPEMPITALTMISAEPDHDDPLDAEAHDQPAGEEARHEHAEHMPLDAERRVGDRMAAIDHGERRRGHHHVHHR